MDLRPLILLGIAAFAVGGVVCAVLMALDVAALRHVGICVAGVLLGGVGLVWERGHRRSYRGED
ncbi:hypothetical protein EDF32_0657 [Cellulomonas sp. PhB143]|nr:hypothetical protein EDF32_0657 [Cellulomonas sp. PhB143]